MAKWAIQYNLIKVLYWILIEDDMAIFNLQPTMSTTCQLSNCLTEIKYKQINETICYKIDNLLGCNYSSTRYSSIGMPTIPTGQITLQEIAWL